MTTCIGPPEAFIQQLENAVEKFEEDGKESLRVCGDYSRAPFPFAFPKLLFEEDAVDLFNDILSMKKEGFCGVVLNEFKDFIHTQNVWYMDAYELFEQEASEDHSVASSVVDLFPVGVCSCPERRARYDSLCIAYAWLHEEKNVKSVRDGEKLPAIFSTDECIFLYSVVVRGKIGKWLTENRDMWL